MAGAAIIHIFVIHRSRFRVIGLSRGSFRLYCRLNFRTSADLMLFLFFCLFSFCVSGNIIIRIIAVLAVWIEAVILRLFH